MNWQNCHDMIFCGLSDSFEQFYQAIRRCYRFGQNQEVNVHIVISEKEMNVLNNIKQQIFSPAEGRERICKQTCIIQARLRGRWTQTKSARRAVRQQPGQGIKQIPVINLLKTKTEKAAGTASGERKSVFYANIEGKEAPNKIGGSL